LEPAPFCAATFDVAEIKGNVSASVTAR